MKNQTSKPKKDVFQIITDAILAQMEKGVIPWKKPWNSVSGGIAPANYVTKKQYRGVNVFLVYPWAFDVPYYLTFNQVKSLGGEVLAGSKGFPVVFWKMLFFDANDKKCDERTAFKKIPILNYYTVFNISQTKGIAFDLPKSEPVPEFQKIKNCEDVLKNMSDCPKIVPSPLNEAYYTPYNDVISMPKEESFSSAQAYYATLFHELVHSTGHAKRLNREGVTEPTKFGTEKYSFEELVAELGAYFLCAHTNISNEDLNENSVAYLQNWISVLKNDNKFILKASSLAQKAFAHIVPTTEENELAEAS